MKLKLNKDGSAVVRNGAPVYVMPNGTEREIDGAAAWKLALGKHFETSPVMAGLKLPPDVAAAFFGDSFRLDGGKLVAVDKHGIQLYSPTRHGEVASFDEAFGQMVEQYEGKGMIQREGGAATPDQHPQGGAAAGAQPAKGRLVTREVFDAMPPIARANFINGGGRINDAAAPAPVGAPPVSQPQGGAKTMTRTVFDATPPLQVAAFLKAGGKIVD